MEQLNQVTELNGLPVMTNLEYALHIGYVEELEIKVVALLKVIQRDEAIIAAFANKNLELESQHDWDTRMMVNNPLNRTKEVKA